MAGSTLFYLLFVHSMEALSLGWKGFRQGCIFCRRFISSPNAKFIIFFGTLYFISIISTPTHLFRFFHQGVEKNGKKFLACGQLNKLSSLRNLRTGSWNPWQPCETWCQHNAAVSLQFNGHKYFFSILNLLYVLSVCQSATPLCHLSLSFFWLYYTALVLKKKTT